MFDDPSRYLWLIPALPLAACALTAFLGPGLLRQKSHWPCVIAAVLAFVLSLGVFIAVARDKGGVWNYGPWFRVGEVDVSFSLRADGLSAVMLVTVTFVGSLIAVFSIGYMHGDEGYARFFAEIALFLFSMTGLILANNYILLYGFWEGVGVCSYLLIGHYYQRPSAVAAGRKAFLVTRLGDVGMFIGILLLWYHFGSLDYNDLFLHGSETPDRGVVVLACLLLFCGAVGKSAQFPLHVWLPDAMEGPTPVSALIHAATMVTAGVYLLARSTPLFVRAPEVQLVVACIACFTALLAALMAITQTDLKRVLAYSTISQLGFMFLALGSGLQGAHIVVLAVTAAIFHLVTHAFFKALLFLSSGSVMHAMGGIIDMRRFSGLRNLLPITHWMFLCGAAALAGVPIITSGFWSKDDILETALEEGPRGGPYGGVYVLLFIVALLTAGLTAFYTFRAYFLTFWGPTRLPPEAEHHAHESPPVMTVPLIILAVGAIGLGIVIGPTGLLENFFQEHWLRSSTMQRAVLEEPEHGMDLPLMLLSGVVALGGIAAAWRLYVRQPDLPAEIVQRAPAVYALSRNRFYLDEIYTVLVVLPLAGLAAFCRAFDRYFVDGLVDALGQVPSRLGKLISPIQNGLTQFYALLMLLGLTGFLLAVLLR